MYDLSMYDNDKAKRFYPWCYIDEFKDWAEKKGFTMEEAFDYILMFLPEKYVDAPVMCGDNTLKLLAFWASVIRSVECT